MISKTPLCNIGTATFKFFSEWQNCGAFYQKENVNLPWKPIALIAVKMPQQALDKEWREELQRKAGSRLQNFINDEWFFYQFSFIIYHLSKTTQNSPVDFYFVEFEWITKLISIRNLKTHQTDGKKKVETET